MACPFANKIDALEIKIVYQAVAYQFYTDELSSYFYLSLR